MEVVVGTYHLGLGGTESYSLTVAEQLQRLGHGITVFYGQDGPGVEVARERGLAVTGEESELPPSCDLVYAQDSIMSYLFADHYPTTSQVYAAHADEYDLQTPPQIPGVVQALVVLNERIARHVRALAHVPEIVRLRQPVDAKRFYPRTGLRPTPRRALLLGNYLNHGRRELLERACADAGIVVEYRGLMSGIWARQPELDLCSADIVFGKARVIVEAMACGRAAYVYDHNGGDGWVTRERYPLLEADNFGGQADGAATDYDRLRRDLDEYSPEMGAVNRDLAVGNHSASRHVQELVPLFMRVAELPREQVVAPLRELSRLVRLQWASECREMWATGEAIRLRGELDRYQRLSPPRVLRKVARTVRDRVRSI